MLRRVEGDDKRSSMLEMLETLGLAQSQAVVPVVPDAELETTSLPHDHPKWVKDALAVSNRARALLARIEPVVVRILTFWDHRIRSIVVGERNVDVDASGSYRMR